MSINWWTHKQTAVCPCNEIYYFTLKKNELLIHATTWIISKALYQVKEGRHKLPHTVWLHSYEILEMQNYSDRKQISRWQEPDEGEATDCKREQRTFLREGNVLCHDYGGVYMTVPFVKIHCTLHLKLVNFIMCKLYLNKADFLKCNVL